MKSVKWILQSLNFDYAHVVVCSVLNNVPLGGGTPAEVMRRFGMYNVYSSSIRDNVLFLRVLG